MPLLYGGNVVKAHVGRFTEDTPEHQGVVILSMDDKPLGFGVTAVCLLSPSRLGLFLFYFMVVDWMMDANLCAVRIDILLLRMIYVVWFGFGEWGGGEEGRGCKE